MIRHIAMTAAAAALTFTAAPALAQVGELAPAVEATDTANTQAEQMPISVNFDVTQDRGNILFLDLSNGERVAIRLVPQWAPNHVERIKTLTREGFYNGVPFHRVIDGFMAQTGDPTGTGQGGSTLPDLEEEFNFLPHVRGTVSMARADDEDSANSQFFIVFYPRFALDRRYTNFGRVIQNMAAVDAINRGEPPANPTRVLQASIASDNVAQMMPSAAAPELDEPVTLDMLNAPLEN
ncbi:peptidylprolyl isomerase [Aurantiacibacter gangjinensis]|uniref:Peptidyl-prolyl cis-trans isomerase n=1 Tax=Aurantiacibacter gangjinensis TaxID=502682 RepID=A0A0G9MQ05_9SPHN|nr:peptidylprolyl isomerase [Aurantiacibacter gangjinensis]APE28641.1 Peptidyl-prolyl cis-trans isomerase [Aurantiacibacter gangjinensis]KLE32817.1 peptidylprolyl isomerase [Aurantiacibacter gangjinensis]